VQREARPPATRGVGCVCVGVGGNGAGVGIVCGGGAHQLGRAVDGGEGGFAVGAVVEADEVQLEIEPRPHRRPAVRALEVALRRRRRRRRRRRGERGEVCWSEVWTAERVGRVE
jgi:hypothetical protein